MAFKKSFDMLPQLCQHLIGSYLEDVINDEYVVVTCEYLRKRQLEIYDEAIQFLNTEKIKKKCLAVLRVSLIDLRDARLQRQEGFDYKYRMLVTDRLQGGAEYKRLTEAKYKAIIFEMIKINIECVEYEPDIHWQRRFKIDCVSHQKYKLAEAYRLYGAIQFVKDHPK